MAISVTHAFVSAKGDGSDATLVRPSNWNAEHTITMATNKVLGRLTAGPGAAEELPVTSYMMGLLNTADYAALAVLLALPTTGDAKLTYKSTADPGWILANDSTIGDTGSGAGWAGPLTQALFTLFYNQFSDAICPVQTSTGVGTTRAAQGTAATAFGTAKCRMVIPKTLGRALLIGGAGAGLTGRALGSIGGTEWHQLVWNEMPSHSHTVTPTGSISATDTNHTHQQAGSFNTGTQSADHSHTQQGTFTSGTSNQSLSHSHSSDALKQALYTGSGADGPYQFPNATLGATINATELPAHNHNVTISGQTQGVSVNHYHAFTLYGSTGWKDQNVSHGHTFTGGSNTTSGAGSDWGHNNMQPWTAWNIMIKL